MKIQPISRKANLVIQEMEGEILIYDLNENKAFCLNQTAALVWQLCDGNKSVDEISEILGQKLNSSANEDIVWFALDQLKKEKLVENEAQLGNYFAGISRREVIKKVGLGTMIALPIVASITAPIALNAASGCTPVTNGCTCAMSGLANGSECLGANLTTACVSALCRCIKQNKAVLPGAGIVLLRLVMTLGAIAF